MTIDYRNRASDIRGTSIGAADFPGALNWAYQEELNHQADLLFWHQTGYKPNQSLNLADSKDRAKIPLWWAARAQVFQKLSPQVLIRARAIRKVLDVHQGDPRPLFVHADGPGGSETRAFAAQDSKRLDDFVRDQARSASYVAIFNAADPRWPQPVYEEYPAGEVAIDLPSPNVSGEVARGHYGSRRRKGYR